MRRGLQFLQFTISSSRNRGPSSQKKEPGDRQDDPGCKFRWLALRRIRQGIVIFHGCAILYSWNPQRLRLFPFLDGFHGPGGYARGSKISAALCVCSAHCVSTVLAETPGCLHSDLRFYIPGGRAREFRGCPSVQRVHRFYTYMPWRTRKGRLHYVLRFHCPGRHAMLFALRFAFPRSWRTCYGVSTHAG